MGNIWGFIYVFNVKQKQYVGLTTNLKQRFKYHFREKKQNTYFHNSLRKYFQPKCFHILEAFYGEVELIVKILKEKEKFWIEKLNTFHPNGWNLTKGGEGAVGYRHTLENKLKISKGKKGKKCSEQHKKNIGLSKKGNKNPKFWLGKHLSKITRNKISKKLKKIGRDMSGINNPMFGKKCPKQSLRMKERKGEKHPMYKKHQTSEAKEKNRLSHFGMFAGEKHPQARKVLLVSPEGERFEIVSYGPFCKEHNLNKGNICSLLRGKYTQVKGWTGKYLD